MLKRLLCLLDRHEPGQNVIFGCYGCMTSNCTRCGRLINRTKEGRWRKAWAPPALYDDRPH